uniref:Uncharacterized protein n=1 Tax=Seriola lalandi dorsalis TaxID=1841481 RepID=A0A3B4YM29_SERLL
DWERNSRAAKLLLCKLAWTPSRLARGDPCLLTGASATFPGVIMPVHLLICFCRYFRWLTFLLDFTGLSRASLILLEAESMKLSKSRVVSLRLPSRLFSTSYSITEPGNPAATPVASAVIREPKVSSEHVFFPLTNAWS